MDSLFSTIGYLVFGKRWVFWQMRHGLKTAVWVNEAEIEMHRAKIRKHQDFKANFEAQLKTIEAANPLEGLEEPKESKDKKAYYDAVKLRTEGQKNAIEDLKGKIRAENDNISGTDGELQRIYNITYHNRLKYDFMRTYKPKTSYAD